MTLTSNEFYRILCSPPLILEDYVYDFKIKKKWFLPRFDNGEDSDRDEEIVFPKKARVISRSVVGMFLLTLVLLKIKY